MIATDRVTNVLFAGLGGQGVLKASDVLAEAAFRAGHDVKKSEIHGMSQRGGSVTSDVRFGPVVLSPMIPYGETDYLIVLSEDQAELHLASLRADGKVLSIAMVQGVELPNRKSANVALLGVLSPLVAIADEAWEAAIVACFPEKLRPPNRTAFACGRALAQTTMRT